MFRSNIWAKWFSLAAGTAFLCTPGAAAEPPLTITGITQTNGVARIGFTPVTGAQEFRLLYTPSLDMPYMEIAIGTFNGYDWSGLMTNKIGFYRIEAVPLDTNALAKANILNRIAYGPSPDDIDHLDTVGTAAYIAEQLAPEDIEESLDFATTPTNEWQHAIITGTATSSTLYIYLDSAGEVFIDDLFLASGNTAEMGTNLLANGSFEAALTGPWTVSTNLTPSSISTLAKHSGNSSLRLVSTSAGTTRESSIYQVIAPALRNNSTYTLSYWYLPSTNGNNLTIRLAGRGIESTHSVQPGSGTPAPIYTLLSQGLAEIDDLRAWYLMSSIQSKRQLLHTLLQFIDNHFTTKYGKTHEYINGRTLTTEEADHISTDFEFRELLKWREVLLNPDGNFYDLLQISAESPAMVIYLDTVTTRAESPNENYSRELVELFTMGVDNGYDQHDIEEMSRAWTGWRVDKLPFGLENNPFAEAVIDPLVDPGYWTLRYRTNRHDNTRKTIFPGKTVAARFGAPYAGRNYQLVLPARTGNAGMQDGYDIINLLANLPQTQEYLSVKLCQLFIHENFIHGVYDYRATNLTAEAQLVRACMAAWETSGPDGRKGNLRQVLSVIFNSDLFHQNAGTRQKVKTPLEFLVSSIRALRAEVPGGYTADTDGYDLLTPLRRLGIRLYDRDDPDGWSEFGRDWINTSSVIERIRFVQNLLVSASDPLKDRDYGGSGDDNLANPVSLLKAKLPTADWRNAGAVVDYFLSILFLGEGTANLGIDRAAAIAFLDSNDTGTPGSSPFSGLDTNSATYDTRVRGMVSFLMALPRFQEQ